MRNQPPYFPLVTSIALVAVIGACSGQPVGLADNLKTAADSGRGDLRQIVVTPKTASLDANRSFRFSAYGRTDANDSVAVSANWSTNGGAITSDGNFTAPRTSGDFQVVAAASGRADTARIRVTGDSVQVLPDTTSTAAKAAECATPRAGWIWCDDFEQDRLSRYFEYNNAGGRFARASGTGYAGSTAMQAQWTTGAQDAGFLHLAFGQTPQSRMTPVDNGTAVYREVYWRLYLKNQAGWTGGGADKLSRAVSLASSTTYAEAAFAHVWAGNSTDAATRNYLMIDPASGTDEAGNLKTTEYNDFPNMRWLGSAVGHTPIFDGAHVGQWRCVEAHVRLNSAGKADGLFELWIDGAPEAQRTGLNFVGSAPFGINAVYFENYWNAGSVQTQARWIDNIVVSTARIGCL